LDLDAATFADVGQHQTAPLENDQVKRSQFTKPIAMGEKLKAYPLRAVKRALRGPIVTVKLIQARSVAASAGQRQYRTRNAQA
jgi:hypothetical protein